MGLAASRVYQWIAKSIAAFGFVVRTSATSKTGNPSINAGTGAPTALEPKASVWLRTDGASAAEVLYVATDAIGTWVALTIVAAASVLAESVVGAGITITGAATASASFAAKIAGTINHATNNYRAVWGKASAITTARTAGTVAAFVAELVGFATDTSGATYVAYDGIAPTANGGSAVYVWGRIAAGYAALLDLTGVATGEAIIKLKDNLAVAAAFKVAATAYLTFVTTDGAESVAAGVRLTTTDAVASGIARVVGGKVYSNVAASTAITGATETEAQFDALISLPANTLKAGTVVRIRAQGIYTATTGSENHSLILQIGSVALCTLALVDPANSDLFYFDAIIVCRDAGATGHIVATGVELAQAATQVGTAKPWFLASTAIDTTGANIVAVAIDRQGTATDSDSARLDILVVEVIG